mgnify:CR=1 FL=1
MNKKCPFCKKPMMKYKELFGKKLECMARENLPLSISDDTILYWYICNCTNNKSKNGRFLGHNRLYLNGELWLYYSGWYKYGLFIFR